MEPQTEQTQPVSQAPVQGTPVADPSDVQQNKVMAVLAYIGVLVFVPILAAKESKFAMYHANQGLILFIAEVALTILSVPMPLIGCLSILPMVLAILGIINALNGEMKPLPLVGNIQILK